MIVQEKITGQVIEFITTIGENRFIILKGNLANSHQLKSLYLYVRAR